MVLFALNSLCLTKLKNKLFHFIRAFSQILSPAIHPELDEDISNCGEILISINPNSRFLLLHKVINVPCP